MIVNFMVMEIIEKREMRYANLGERSKEDFPVFAKLSKENSSAFGKAEI